MTRIVLEPAARELAGRTTEPPHGYEAARRGYLELQSMPVDKPPVDAEWITVGDSVRVRLVRPAGATGTLPVVLYLHGGGWVLGDATTHDRLVRELAVGATAAVAFVEYDRAPEAKYPVALEQAYAVALWIVNEGAARGLDASLLAVAGDSSGGTMAAALTMMAKDRGDVTFVHQSLYYPATSAARDTLSYSLFADGPFLTAKMMAWFWDAYTVDPVERAHRYAAPLNATLGELTGLPPAFVVVDEADVLRDEGELYAAQLREAGVAVTTVRYDGIHHDFMTLHALARTHAARAAVAQATAMLRLAFSVPRRGPAGSGGDAC
ncbi:alpha/beta hydrolase [Actinoplanes sp. CA-142083]|uniref:alpha/beta hydrolase n=1 Tax=Actinoplanes sp. CA-142083 TaxID=3239903 RepID=UPI003D928676